MATVVVAAFFPSSCSRSHQPVYNGKPLSEWLSELTEDKNNPYDTRDQAQEAIRQIGTNALPFLLKEISDLGELWQKVGATNFSNSKEAETRLFNVHVAFKTLGPIAKPAVPALVDLLNGAYTAFPAAFALTQIDPQAASVALTQALTNKIIYVRIAAAGYLFEVRSNADIVLAMPNLIQCLKDESPDKSDSLTLISTAIDTLGAIHARPDIAVPALLETLTNKDFIIRFVSVRALGQFGNTAISAVPALEQATNDSDKHVREMATVALKQIQEKSP